MSNPNPNLSWEDTLSLNSRDQSPFQNHSAPSEQDYDQFIDCGKRYRVEEVIGDTSLKDLIARDKLPIPSSEDREGYAPLHDGQYWLAGMEDYLKVQRTIAKHQVEVKSLLDFGCSTGRFLRHFAVQSDLKTIWGTDINHRHIRWLLEFMPPQVRPVGHSVIPTLPIEDRSVDLITAFSVFTHIESFETQWLVELGRILTANGLAYITVQNEASWDLLKEHIDNPKNRLVQSMLESDESMKTRLLEPLPAGKTVIKFRDTGPYRAQVFHSNDYLHNVWGRYFHIESILPLFHTRQSVVILRRRG